MGNSPVKPPDWACHTQTKRSFADNGATKRELSHEGLKTTT